MLTYSLLMDPDWEKALFEAFAVPRKRQRYVELLNSKAGREKIRHTLDHFTDLDPRFCQRVKTAEQNPAGILRLLKDLGAPATCYLISNNAEFDGREMGLPEALTAVIGNGWGTFVCCVPGVLAYFEDEGPAERYVCHRKR